MSRAESLVPSRGFVSATLFTARFGPFSSRRKRRKGRAHAPARQRLRPRPGRADRGKGRAPASFRGQGYAARLCSARAWYPTIPSSDACARPSVWWSVPLPASTNQPPPRRLASPPFPRPLELGSLTSPEEARLQPKPQPRPPTIRPRADGPDPLAPPRPPVPITASPPAPPQLCGEGGRERGPISRREDGRRWCGPRRDWQIG